VPPRAYIFETSTDPYAFRRVKLVADAQGVTTRPRRRLIVGVMGRKRAGKDTFAARLVEKHGFTRYAFADALRMAALELDPIVTPVDTVGGSLRLSDVVRQVGWEGAKAHAEVRRTLQRFGQGIRKIDPDFWLRHVLEQIDARVGHAVITDVRYPNEAEAIRVLGGELVRVVRPGADNSDTHESETALDDYPEDWRVPNDASLGSLHDFADAIVEHLLRVKYPS